MKPHRYICGSCAQPHNGSFGSGKFCRRSCSNKRTFSKVSKEKIRKSIRKHICRSGMKLQDDQTTIHVCRYCKKVFVASKESKGFHSVSCSTAYYNKKRGANATPFRKYKQECKFRFNIFDYPKEFDLDILKKYGWYQPSNRGNNLNGVSRDHIFSIREGFRLGINPALISHPANCQLVRHHENNMKKTRCDISIKELCQKVKAWDSTYGMVSGGF